MSATPAELVRALCDGLTGGDMAPLLAYLHPEVHYHNKPWAPLVGAAAVGEFLQPFVDGTHCRLARMSIHHELAAGNLVMNARSELWVKGELEVDLPVAGVFTVEDGVIVRWEDYFDAATMQPIMELI
ncbi:MAG: limonene-1,2-epoxide hydrolase family protein [Gammaproteobacteria bacterium]